MTSTGSSGVTTASWLVSIPIPAPLPGPLPPNQGTRAGRPAVWVPLVGWGQEGMVWWGLEEPGDQISQPAPQLPPSEKVRDSWKEDAFFGYQFLNGANPMLLRRSSRLPTRLVFPSGMEEVQAQLEQELQVWT